MQSLDTTQPFGCNSARCTLVIRGRVRGGSVWQDSGDVQRYGPRMDVLAQQQRRPLAPTKPDQILSGDKTLPQSVVLTIPQLLQTL